MKRLFLLRHAKSAWPEGVEDHDRPLGERGRRDAPRMGAYMASAGLLPDLALVSSARRTLETWRLLAPELGGACPSRTLSSIYEAEPEAILAAIRTVPDGCGTLLVVGHNPGLELLAASLAPDGDPASIGQLREKYPTAGLAVIGLGIAGWADAAPGAGRLESFMTPKTLP